MDMVAILKHCFHRVKNKLHENDLAVLDQHIPQEDRYRQYMADYIEELSTPFAEVYEKEDQSQGTLQIFRKYYISEASLNSMLLFLNDFANKPVSEIDQSHHAEGIKAFKNFIRRWENNAQGNDLVKFYKRYNNSFD